MNRLMINIMGIEHAVEYWTDTGDPVEDRIWPDENICCTYIKKIRYIIIPNINIARINLNYCPVCGTEIRHE